MRVLALIHEPPPCSGVFAEVAALRGDEVEEWNLAWGTPPSLPLDEYGAVWLFGGVVNTHEEEDHPWLREENLLIRSFLDRRVPLLGICLGGQLIAKATNAPITRTAVPEIGFHDVWLTPQAVHDPLFGGLPERMMALQWHYYRFDVPAGSVTLAANTVCPQAYRLGELAWGLQFHAETTREDWLRWIAEWDSIPGADRTGFDPDRLRKETELYMDRWNELGRELAGRFLDVAQHADAGARRSVGAA